MLLYKGYDWRIGLDLLMESGKYLRTEPPRRLVEYPVYRSRF